MNSLLLKSPILVYKTNLMSEQQAQILKNQLLQQLPDLLIHFDLDDCDRILRVEGDISQEKIQGIALLNHIWIEELAD